MRYFFFGLIIILGCKEKPKTVVKSVHEDGMKEMFMKMDSLKYKAINEPIWINSNDTINEKYRFWISYGMGIETRYVFRLEKINEDSFKLIFKYFTCDNNCNPFTQNVTERNYHIIESKEIIFNKWRNFDSALNHFEFWQLEDPNIREEKICDGNIIRIEGIRPMVDKIRLLDKTHFKTYQSLHRDCVYPQNPLYELVVYTLNLIGQKNIKTFDTPSVFLQKQEKN